MISICNMKYLIKTSRNIKQKAAEKLLIISPKPYKAIDYSPLSPY